MYLNQLGYTVFTAKATETHKQRMKVSLELLFYIVGFVIIDSHQEKGPWVRAASHCIVVSYSSYSTS